MKNLWRRNPSSRLTAGNLICQGSVKCTLPKVADDFFEAYRTITSTRTSTGAYTTDLAKNEALHRPLKSAVFSIWHKPDALTGAYPRACGNHEVLHVGGTNWNVQQILDNMTIESTGVCSFWNMNTQFFAGTGILEGDWVADFTGWNDSSETLTEAIVQDWKWACWQVIKDDTLQQFTFRQWIKYGMYGNVIKTGSWYDAPHYDEVVTYAEIRALLVSSAGWDAGDAAAWVPDDIIGFGIGDTFSDGTGSKPNVAFAKLWEMDTEPTLDQLDSWALQFYPDRTAIGDWPFNNVGGTSLLTDRSGNGNALTQVGTLLSGYSFEVEDPSLPDLLPNNLRSSSSVGNPVLTSGGAGDHSLTATGISSASSVGAPALTSGGGSATIKSNTAEGGTNTTVVTTGNSGGASGDAFDNVVGAPTFSTAHPFAGSMGYYSPGGGTASTLDWNVPTMTAYGVKTSFWCADLTLATPQIIIVEDSATYDYMKVEISQWDSKAYLSRSTNESVASTITLSNSTHYLFEMEVDNATNSASLKIYNSSLTLLDTLNLTLVSDVDCNKISFGTGFNSTAQTYYDSLEVYDPTAGGGDTSLTALGLVSASSVGTPALSQNHALAPTGLTCTSVVGTPAISQNHILVASGVSSASAVGAPSLSQNHALTALGPASASSVGTPTLGQNHAIAALPVASASTVGAPALSQNHALEPVGIVSASSVGNPALSSSAVNYELTALGLSADSLTGSPALGQDHILAALDVGSESFVGSPALFSSEGIPGLSASITLYAAMSADLPGAAPSSMEFKMTVAMEASC